MQPAETPRSYVVSIPTGSIRRNRQHLTAIPESHSDHDITNIPEQTIAVQPLPLTFKQLEVDIYQFQHTILFLTQTGTLRKEDVVGCMYLCNNWNRTHVICTSARCMSVTVNLLDLAQARPYRLWGPRQNNFRRPPD